MARIRTIKPDFWDDLKIAKISRDARLLYIGMWNFADDLGVIIGDHLWIKSKIFPFDQIQVQQFDKWMQDLVKSEFISLFSHNGEEFYYLSNLTRHQVINKPNYDKLNVPKSSLDGALSHIHGMIPEQSRNDTGMLLTGEERKGVGKEGKREDVNDGDVPPPQTLPASNAYVKFSNWVKKKLPNVSKLKSQITEDEFDKLISEFSKDRIIDILGQMENKADLTKKYTSVYLTALSWLKRDREVPQNKTMPL